MGYTAQSFTVGQKLTSTQLNTIDQNFDAIADGDPSAPRLPRPNIWVHFCGFSTADKGIYAQRGVSSFTRNGTGDYTIAFTTPLSSTNVGMSISTDSAFAYTDVSVRNANCNALTTTEAKFRYHAANASGNAVEDQVAIFATVWDYGAGGF